MYVCILMAVDATFKCNSDMKFILKNPTAVQLILKTKIKYSAMVRV